MLNLVTFQGTYFSLFYKLLISFFYSYRVLLFHEILSGYWSLIHKSFLTLWGLLQSEDFSFLQFRTCFSYFFNVHFLLNLQLDKVWTFWFIFHVSWLFSGISSFCIFATYSGNFLFKLSIWFSVLSITLFSLSYWIFNFISHILKI